MYQSKNLPKGSDCLNGLVPFIITDELKLFYYRGLCEWAISTATSQTLASPHKTNTKPCFTISR